MGGGEGEWGTFGILQHQLYSPRVLFAHTLQSSWFLRRERIPLLCSLRAQSCTPYPGQYAASTQAIVTQGAVKRWQYAITAGAGELTAVRYRSQTVVGSPLAGDAALRRGRAFRGSGRGGESPPVALRRGQRRSKLTPCPSSALATAALPGSQAAEDWAANTQMPQGCLSLTRGPFWSGPVPRGCSGRRSPRQPPFQRRLLAPPASRTGQAPPLPARSRLGSSQSLPLCKVVRRRGADILARARFLPSASASPPGKPRVPTDGRESDAPPRLAAGAANAQ